MKKIEIVIRPSKLEKLKSELTTLGVRGMTIYDVMGRGMQQAVKQYYRGQEHSVDLFPKVKIEIVCQDQAVEDIISSVLKICKSGETGDGKIFVYPVERIIRISTREEGEAAL